MRYKKKYKTGRAPRYEVTANIPDVGEITHVIAVPENEEQTLRDAVAEKLKRAYPKKALTILRIVQRR